MATKKEGEYKWKFAIGTTSRVPGRTDLHYLIADFDGIDFIPITAIALLSDSLYVTQKTPNGIHLFSNFKCTFKEIVRFHRIIGCDTSWCRIGRNRGYWFLADKAPIEFSWPVERMTLKWSDPYGEKR